MGGQSQICWLTEEKFNIASSFTVPVILMMLYFQDIMRGCAPSWWCNVYLQSTMGAFDVDVKCGSTQQTAQLLLWKFSLRVSTGGGYIHLFFFTIVGFPQQTHFHCSMEAFSSQFSHTCSDASTATSCPSLSVHSSSQAVIHTRHLLMQLRGKSGALGLMQSISPLMQTQQKCNKNEEAWVKIVISILLIARRDRMHTPRQPQHATCETH